MWWIEVVEFLLAASPVHVSVAMGSGLFTSLTPLDKLHLKSVKPIASAQTFTFIKLIIVVKRCCFVVGVIQAVIFHFYTFFHNYCYVT